MRLCVVTFKECWQGDDGGWLSYGGFPAQMASLASLFDEVVLVVTRGPARGGGMPLPTRARVVPLALPPASMRGASSRCWPRLPYYLAHIRREVRSRRRGARAGAGRPAVPRHLCSRRRWASASSVCTTASWAPNAETTIMNRVTRQWMRTFGGARSLMLAVGDGVAPPAPNVDWLFATALSDREVACTAPDLDARPARPTAPRLPRTPRPSRRASPCCSRRSRRSSRASARARPRSS